MIIFAIIFSIFVLFTITSAILWYKYNVINPVDKEIKEEQEYID